MNSNLQNLIETQELLLNKTDLVFKRFLYERIDFKKSLIGIIGPRGVGKTTLILQYLKEKYHNQKNIKALYILADNVFFEKGDLLEFAREFHLKKGGTLLCIDEIHRYENWNQELKNIYDTLPDLKVIFSGSSSLNLVRGKYDLSRRGIIYYLPGLSFREYLLFEKKIDFSVYSLESILKKHQLLASQLMKKDKYILKYFSDYLGNGYYPFFKETGEQKLYFSQIINTIDKAIYEDIASFYSLKTRNLVIFRQILNFLTTIPPGEINVNKLAMSLGNNHVTISEYLEILEEAGLVRFLPLAKTGHGMLRKAKKVFLDNTNLAQALDFSLGSVLEIGTMRELFALNQLQNSGLIPVFSDRGDFKLDDRVIEIGGRNKNDDQIKDLKKAYLFLDDILIGENRKIPLYLLGFLY